MSADPLHDNESIPGVPRPATGGDGWFWASDAPSDGARIEMRRRDDGGMDVRTSDEPDKIMTYTRNEWVCFLDGCANFEFDHLAADDPADPAEAAPGR